MKRMYEFACENGHHIEKLTSYEVVNVQCECGVISHRKISAPNIKLEGWSGNFPTSAHQFDRKHREKLAAELKENS
jgi:hypothetical protein